jgi:hypothetical protein
MGFDEVIIFEKDDLVHFLMFMQACTRDPNVHTLRFAMDEGGLKVKVNHWAWTSAYGKQEESLDV